MRLSSSIRSSLSLLLALGVVAACVPTTNQYDPETPAESQAKASVQGRVVAESLESPEGLSVALMLQGEVAFTGETGGEGSFLVNGVQPGSYVFELRETGFVPFLLPIILAAGETLKLGDIVLVPEGGENASAVIGVATLEGQGEGEHGGILVEAVGRSFTSVTTSSGEFRLPVLAGSYDLRFSKASFQGAAVDGVVVAAGEEKDIGAVVLLANPATLTGHIEGELPSGALSPLDEATITLEGTALTALSNASGDFTLSGVPPGSHLLRVVKDGYVSESTTVANVIGGETRPLGSFELTLQKGGISGVIALADTADASGVIVELTGSERAQITGTSGAFTFTDVLLGSYSLTARKDGYNARNLGTFTVAADVVTSTGSVTLSRKSGLVSIVEGAATSSPNISLLISAPTATGYKASEDPTFQDPTLGDIEADAFRVFVPGEPAPFTLSDADGSHTVYVVTSDGTTTSSPASAEVVLDREAPIVSTVVIGSGAAFLASQSGIVTLHLEGFDLPPLASPGVAVSGIVKMRLSNDPTQTGAQTVEYRTTTTHTLADPSSEGEKTVYARFLDAAGNESEIASAVVILDNTEPADVSLVLGGDSDDPSYTRSPFLTAVLAAVDDNGGTFGEDLLVRLSNDAGFTGASYQPFGAGLLTWLASPGDGEKTVYAQVRDPAGNESLVVSDVITLDSTPPSGAFLLVAGGAATTTTAQVTLTLAASGASQMAVSQDGFSSGVTWEPYASSKSYALTTQGNVTVSAKFKDDAGWETGVVTDSIVYDATAPAAGTLVLTGTLGDGKSSVTLTASNIVLADPLPALADRNEQLSMSLVESNDASCTAADFPVSPLFVPYGRTSVVLSAGDGNKTVCVIFKDAAGNFDRATARGTTLRLDSAAPSAPIFEDVTSGLTNETSITATLTPSADAGGGVVEHRCYGGVSYGGGGAVCNPASPIVFMLEEDSENTLGVRACDAARNCAESRITVVQDATAPLTPVLKSIAANESAISVSWHASASSDVAGYALYYGTAPGDRGSADAEQGASPIFVGDVTSFQLSGLAQGTTYYVSVAAMDEAGNLGDPSGELAATPSKSSVRFVSSFGGRPRQLGVFGTRGYIAEPQGIVQVDLTKSIASQTRIGRASVPNVVPDSSGALTALPCSAEGVVGDCVLFFGSTLEGELREDEDNFRAGTSLVYFPRTGTSTAPAQGRVLTTLPTQARAVVVDPDDASVFYTVDSERVRGFRLAKPSGSTTDAPFAVGRADHATPLKQVLAAGVAGDYVYVVALPAEPNLACIADVYACAELYATDRQELKDGKPMVGDALGILVAQGGGPVTLWGGHGYAFANGLNVISTIPNASDPTGLDFEVAHHHADASGLLSLTPTSSRRVVMNARGASYPLVVAAHNGRVYTAANDVTVQQLYSVNVAANGTLSAGPSAPRFAQNPQELSVFAVGDGYVFAAETATVAEAEQLLMRWTIPASGNYPTFGEVLVPPTGTAMAYSDGLVLLGQGQNIYAFDVSNARAPTLLGAPATNPTRVNGSYDRLRVQGHLLFASSYGGQGIDIFRFDGAQGGLVYLSTAGAAQYNDFAVVGDRLYAARAFASYPLEPGFDRFLISNPASPTTSTPCITASVVPWHVSAFAVRHDTAFMLNGSDKFRTIDVDTCTQLSADITAPGSLGSGQQRHVTVSGARAIVSNYQRSYAVNVVSPASPSFNTTLAELPLAGATTQAGGYAIGLGNYNPNSGLYQPGPRLLNPLGEIDGFLAHAPCGQRGSGFSSLVLANGTLFASCDDLGIQIVSLAHATGGTLLQERAGYSNFRNDRDRLATDGSYAFLGNFQTLYDISGELFSAGYPSVFLPVPQVNTDLGVDVVEGLFEVTGTVVTVINASPPTNARVQLRDAADVDNAWPVTGTYTLGNISVTDTPVTSGRRMYVPVNDGTGAGTGVRVLNLNDHNALSNVAFTSTPVDEIALSRDRLYLLTYDENGARLRVYRLTDAGTLGASPGDHALELPGGFEANDLSVHGGFVLLTASANGQSAVVFFEDPGFGTASVTSAQMRWVTSTLPFADPTVSGDVLFVAENLGVSSFDVSGTFSRAFTTPPRLGSIATGDARTNNLTDLVMAGPFMFLAGDRYRVFDMR